MSTKLTSWCSIQTCFVTQAIEQVQRTRCKLFKATTRIFEVRPRKQDRSGGGGHSWKEISRSRSSILWGGRPCAQTLRGNTLSVKLWVEGHSWHSWVGCFGKTQVWNGSKKQRRLSINDDAWKLGRSLLAALTVGLRRSSSVWKFASSFLPRLPWCELFFFPSFFLQRWQVFLGGAISYSLKMHRPWRKFNHLSWQRNERVQDALWSAWQLLSTPMPLPYSHLCWHLSWSVALAVMVYENKQKKLNMQACRLTFPLLLAVSFSLSSRSLTPCDAFRLPAVSRFPLFLSAPEPVKFKFSPPFFWRDELLCCILRMPSVFAGSSSF